MLSGFIRCDECGKTLIGQTQKSAHGKFDYQYYRHFDGKHRDCRAFSSIKTENIDNAVFKAIFENTGDEVSFQEAIKESLPDEKYRGQLERNITNDEKKLNQIERDLDKLVNALLEDTLKKETIKQKETALETREIFSPLAHRLGIWKLKWELEDLSFSYLEPDKYEEIKMNVAVSRQEREGYISEFINQLFQRFY